MVSREYDSNWCQMVSDAPLSSSSCSFFFLHPTLLSSSFFMCWWDDNYCGALVVDGITVIVAGVTTVIEVKVTK